MIEWMIYTEASCGDALSNRRYMDVNSSVIYCTYNFIPWRRGICTWIKKSNKTCCM